MRALPEIEPGTQLGPYEVGAELGRGGIAVVYRARHTELPNQPELALKVAFRTNEQRDRRFIREFERLRVIAIPGVTRVYEAGTTEELIWYVMDIVPGQPMNRRIAQARSLEERIEIALHAGARMFDVLDGIHRLGFIHRDIKPSNVLVDDDHTIHVLDFGLVRLQERGDTLTRAGRLVGTVAFMSPEQTTGLPLTPGTDIFSTGLVLYEGLVGPRPRPHRQEEWLGRMCLQRVTPLAIREPRIPRALSTAVDRMLLLDPHARPSAAEAADMMRDIRTKRSTPDWPVPPHFGGREGELERLMQGFESAQPSLTVLLGPTGSGRQRLLEQVQRRALLYGTPRITGTCLPEVSGGAVLQILQQLFRTHADPEWRNRAAGPDADALLTMWPTLPLAAPPPSPEAPTIQEVAEATAATIHRAVDSAGLMVVFEGLECVDSLSARVIQLLVQDPPDRLGVFAICDDRWSSPRALRLLRHLTEKGMGNVIQLADLSGLHATELARSLCDDNDLKPIGTSSPQRAREHGLRYLATQRGEVFPPVPSEALPLALTTIPLPKPVLALLNINVDALLEAGVVSKHPGNCYALADETLRKSALTLLPDRATAEDALADALTRGGLGSERWAHVARHMLNGKDPRRALAPAIRAAVHAVQTGRFEEARNWLMVIDPLPRDPADPTYKALYFELAWCRARTSLSTDLSRIRGDLVSQARQRASTAIDRARVDLLEADLQARQGRMEAAVALCEASTVIHNEVDEDFAPKFPLKASRILLDHGLPERARPLIEGVKEQNGSANHALNRIDMALQDGRPTQAAEWSRAAIAKATGPEFDPLQAQLLLRLGTALLDLGDRIGATQAIHRARDSLILHSHRARLAEAHYLVSLLAVGRGQPTAARVLIDPLIATARTFAMGRLQALGWAMKLRLASVMNDKGSARAAIAGRNPNRQAGQADWRIALARWHRVQRDLAQAAEHAQWPAPRTSAEVMLAIESARLDLARGNTQEAMDTLGPALEQSQKRGFSELALLAQMVQGAVTPGPEAEWATIIHDARSSPWIELSLGALAMDGRRRMVLGQKAKARHQFQVLLQRAEHLGHAYHQVVANEALVLL